VERAGDLLLLSDGSAGLTIAPAQCDLFTAAGDPGFAHAPLAVAPNPSRGSARIQFRLGAAGPVDARIYGVDGRLVRSLHAGALAAGVRELVWDGRDEAGRPAPAGVYFVRVRTAAGTQSGRVVRLR
jgi:hypothetical protein